MASGLIYFKLRSQISFSTITFDGHFVSVGEARKLIALKQSLAPEAAEELVLSNPKTGQEYRDDTEQLPKGTSVIVRRVPGGVRLRPLVGATPVPGGPSGAAQATSSAPQQQPVASGGDAAQPGAAADEFGADPFVAAALKAQQEAAQAAAAAAAAATRQEAASARGGFGGRGPGGRGGRGSRMPHPTYVCPRCNLIGKHWVSDCPTQGDPAYDVRSVREPRGIPQGKVVKNTEGSMLLPGGVLGELVTNTHAYEQTVAHMMGKVQEQEADQGQKQQGQVLAIEAPPAKQPDQPKPATQQASTAPAAVQEKPQQPQQQQGSDGAAPDHKSPDAAPTEASAPGLFDDDDDVLNAAAQPLKLSAPVPAAGSEAVSKGGPITKSGGSPPPVAQPADVDAALIQYEREALPEDLRRPFCTPKEFLDHLPLLVEILPAAAPRMLLKAFGAGLPLTRTEFEQLKQQEATAALAAKTAAAEAAAAAQAPAANGKHGSSKGGSKGDEDRSKRSSAKRRSRSRSRSRDRSSRRSRRDTSPSRHHHHSDSSRHHRDGSRDGRDRGADKEVRASGSSRRAPSKLNPEHGTAGSNHQNAAQQVEEPVQELAQPETQEPALQDIAPSEALPEDVILEDAAAAAVEPVVEDSSVLAGHQEPQIATHEVNGNGPAVLEAEPADGPAVMEAAAVHQDQDPASSAGAARHNHRSPAADDQQWVSRQASDAHVNGRLEVAVGAHQEHSGSAPGEESSDSASSSDEEQEKQRRSTSVRRSSKDERKSSRSHRSSSHRSSSKHKKHKDKDRDRKHRKHKRSKDRSRSRSRDRSRSKERERRKDRDRERERDREERAREEPPPKESSKPPSWSERVQQAAGSRLLVRSLKETLSSATASGQLESRKRRLGAEANGSSPPRGSRFSGRSSRSGHSGDEDRWAHDRYDGP